MGRVIFLAALPIGFLLSKIVPMQVQLASKQITMTFDRIYFALILALVIAKAVTGNVMHLGAWPDALMCVILGIMAGRLSGIGWRVRQLKNRHGLRASRQEPAAGR